MKLIFSLIISLSEEFCQKSNPLPPIFPGDFPQAGLPEDYTKSLLGRYHETSKKSNS